MPHVNPQGTDLVVSVFIVNRKERGVLLVDHRKLGSWFPVGGHVWDEDPYATTDDALEKEISEECGLDVVLVDPLGAQRWRLQGPDFPAAGPHNVRKLRTPWACEVHDFPAVPGHRHLCLIYLGVDMHTRPLVVNALEHKAARWFNRAALLELERVGQLLPQVAWYAHKALDELAPVPAVQRPGYQEAVP